MTTSHYNSPIRRLSQRPLRRMSSDESVEFKQKILVRQGTLGTTGLASTIVTGIKARARKWGGLAGGNASGSASVLPYTDSDHVHLDITDLSD